MKKKKKSYQKEEEKKTKHQHKTQCLSIKCMRERVMLHKFIHDYRMRHMVNLKWETPCGQRQKLPSPVSRSTIPMPPDNTMGKMLFPRLHEARLNLSHPNRRGEHSKGGGTYTTI